MKSNNIKGPMSDEAIMEIFRQIEGLIPEAPMERKIALVGKVYDEHKDDPDIDPAYVRRYLHAKMGVS